MEFEKHKLSHLGCSNPPKSHLTSVALLHLDIRVCFRIHLIDAKFVKISACGALLPQYRRRITLFNTVLQPLT